LEKIDKVGCMGTMAVGDVDRNWDQEKKDKCSGGVGNIEWVAKKRVIRGEGGVKRG